MATLLRSLVCLRVITDKESNTASYIDSVESFAVAHFPYPFPPLFAVTVWKRDREGDKIQARLRVVAPSGKDLAVFPIDQEMRTLIHRHNIALRGFNLEEQGDYRIEIEQQMGNAWQGLVPLVLSVSLAEGAASTQGAA